MRISADENGRISLPTEIREEFGDEYCVVKLPNRVTLLPVDEHSLEGLRDAVGDAFEEVDHDELEAAARSKVRPPTEDDTDDRE